MSLKLRHIGVQILDLLRVVPLVVLGLSSFPLLLKLSMNVMEVLLRSIILFLILSWNSVYILFHIVWCCIIVRSALCCLVNLINGIFSPRSPNRSPRKSLRKIPRRILRRIPRRSLSRIQSESPRRISSHSLSRIPRRVLTRIP